VSSGVYYDGDLIDVFKGIISKSKSLGKQIYYLHLQGSHFNYDERYPSEFNVFKSPNKNRNRYINSILYNDWVVDSLIKVAQSNDVDAIFYLSDHGEDLTYGHNQGNYTKGMSEIPFIVYLSNNYLNRNRNLCSRL